MKETFLLTGGTGYIGSHTAVELIDAGYDTVILDDLSNSDESVVDRIEMITGVRPVFYKGDAADSELLNKIFTENKIDGVIHFAGYKAVGESVKKPLLYYHNNLMTAIAVLEAMSRHNVTRFVFSSSATVYGEKNPVPYTEDMPTGGCTNPYGWTKHMIEQIAYDSAAADDKLSVMLLRYFNPIGAHKSGLIGEKPNGIPNNLMPYVTQVAAGILPELNVFGNDYPTPDGTGVRDFIHVVDLAKGHVAAIAYTKENKGALAVNLGTGKGSSVLDIVNSFEEANGVKVPYRFAPRRAGDLAAFWADAKMAEELLGWKAELTLDDMCRDSWRWQKWVKSNQK
ncbi:MAG: UDP-glucose 4-epimerase GalE [Oscillospiraceae bacterium]|nr:UDP-glucose 4-epimerase GalE [Oscillospiraceae bacterium]